MHHFPDDDDGDAIRRVVADGADLDRPMEVDFMVDVPDEGAATAVADGALQVGYRARVVFDEGDGDAPSWTVYCTREMLLTHAAVVAAQDELDRISQPFGGRTDGWGTFGNARGG